MYSWHCILAEAPSGPSTIDLQLFTVIALIVAISVAVLNIMTRIKEYWKTQIDDVTKTANAYVNALKDSISQECRDQTKILCDKLHRSFRQWTILLNIPFVIYCLSIFGIATYVVCLDDISQHVDWAWGRYLLATVLGLDLMFLILAIYAFYCIKKNFKSLSSYYTVACQYESQKKFTLPHHPIS